MAKPMFISDTWHDVIVRYEYLRLNDHWCGLATAMLALIERIRKDSSFPPTVQVVSHAWLRLGPVIDHPEYRPGVWVGWRKPNYYWIGIGSFGTQRRITVTADHVLSMLKRYLTLLPDIDPELREYLPPEPGETAVHEAETEEILLTASSRYAALTREELLPRLAEEVAGQIGDIREYGEQLNALLDSLNTLDDARTLLDELLKRAEHISQLLVAAMDRYQLQTLPALSEPGDSEVNAGSDVPAPPALLLLPQPAASTDAAAAVRGNGTNGTHG